MMNLQARNCEVKEELEQHFQEKIEGLKRLVPSLDDVQVRVREERGRHIAEVTVNANGLMARGEERAANMQQAFDGAIAKIERQLQRHKGRENSKARRHDNRDDAGTISNPSLAAPATETADPEYSGEEEGVVRVKRFALKPMSAQEAALQMGLLDHSFFVFRDAESHQVSVVYRRNDGGFGIIEPVAD